MSGGPGAQVLPQQSPSPSRRQGVFSPFDWPYAILPTVSKPNMVIDPRAPAPRLHPSRKVPRDSRVEARSTTKAIVLLQANFFLTPFSTPPAGYRVERHLLIRSLVCREAIRKSNSARHACSVIKSS
ncbi:hypothetical protein G7Y89_g11797 [Cudoniella acicularis]|uniref:Uncharacterized protein n=1 Tax=Cudoniella acicularis TaxID=354080 RepID=A0A8H4RCM1_9HELO|nr:hypothetical protein G7Y89_g11797 [Cudoniella acicularis]